MCGGMETDLKKLKISLMLKIVLLCVILVLASSFIVRRYAFQMAKDTLEDTMGVMSLNIIRSVKDTIDADKLSELKTAEDMEKEYYIQLRQELKDLKEKIGLKYLYTMARTEDGIYHYVVDGYELDSDEASLIGDEEADISDIMANSFDGTEGYEFGISEEWGPLISGYIPITDSAGQVIGILAADFDVTDMVKNIETANRNLFVIVFIVAAISILAAVGFSYLIIRSLKELQSKIKLLEDGDLTIDVSESRRDEVGSLSNAFQKMIDSMRKMIHNIHKHSEEVSQDILQLNGNIDISNMATEEIAKISGEIANEAQQQAQYVAGVEDSMQHVFAEIELILKNIEAVNRDSDISLSNMQDATDKLNGSVYQVDLVNNTVETTSEMMKKLEEKFKEVLSFSSSIDAIAAKTNLLALNASIEAASAGEHGRGFAVVAGEIKNLAKQSGEASKKINELINTLREEINNSSASIESGVVQARDGVNAMSEAKRHLEKLSDSSTKINTRIKEIADAIVNIETDSKQVLDKTSELGRISSRLSEGMQQTAAETEEQNAIMEGIRSDLLRLKERMDQLGGTVNQFKV